MLFVFKTFQVGAQTGHKVTIVDISQDVLDKVSTNFEAVYQWAWGGDFDKITNPNPYNFKRNSSNKFHHLAHYSLKHE